MNFVPEQKFGDKPQNAQLKIIPGESRRNEFLSFFNDQKIYELSELKREDVHFGIMDLYVQKENILNQIGQEIEHQIHHHKDTNSRTLPEYRLKNTLPKWLPKMLGVKTYGLDLQHHYENIKQQIDNNLQHFFQFNKQFTQVCAYQQFQNELKIYFEYPEQSLEEDIIVRKQENRPYDEQLLWQILFNLVKASHQMNQHNQNLHDIRPSRVYYNQYQTSVVPYGIFPEQDITIVDKLLQRGHQVLFAPEQQQEFHNQSILKDSGFQSKNFKSESFQIGLTVLMAGLLIPDNCPCFEADNQGRVQFNLQTLQNMLLDFKNKYSTKDGILYYFLDNLLMSANPNLRATPSEVYFLLENKSKHILFLQDYDHFKYILGQDLTQKYPSYSYLSSSSHQHHGITSTVSKIVGEMIHRHQ